MLLAHDPSSGDSEGGAGTRGRERENTAFLDMSSSNNTVAELYICVFQIWKRTDIFKSFLLNGFCMYSIMVLFFFFF